MLQWFDVRTDAVRGRMASRAGRPAGTVPALSEALKDCSLQAGAVAARTPGSYEGPKAPLELDDSAVSAVPPATFRSYTLQPAQMRFSRGFTSIFIATLPTRNGS